MALQTFQIQYFFLSLVSFSPNLLYLFFYYTIRRISYFFLIYFFCYFRWYNNFISIKKFRIAPDLYCMAAKWLREMLANCDVIHDCFFPAQDSARKEPS